jgi:hypothetical protein
MQKSKQEIWAKNHVVLSWHLVRWSIVKVLSGVLIMARTLYRAHSVHRTRTCTHEVHRTHVHIVQADTCTSVRTLRRSTIRARLLSYYRSTVRARTMSRILRLYTTCTSLPHGRHRTYGTTVSYDVRAARLPAGCCERHATGRAVRGWPTSPHLPRPVHSALARPALTANPASYGAGSVEGGRETVRREARTQKIPLLGHLLS